jgi:hypothetical protein
LITREQQLRVGLHVRRPAPWDDGPAGLEILVQDRWPQHLILTEGPRGRVGNLSVRDMFVDDQPVVALPLNGDMQYATFTPSLGPPNLAHVRLVFARDDRPLHDPGAVDPSVFAIAVTPVSPERPPGWYISPNVGVRAVVSMESYEDPEIKEIFASDFLFEVSIAHSAPIRPVIRRVVETIGWDGYLAAKAKFVRTINRRSVYGALQPEQDAAPYTSIAHMGE